MDAISRKAFSGGPFSAVRPYLGDGERKFAPDQEVEGPRDGFEPSRPPQHPPATGAPPAEELRKGAGKAAAQAALGAFPQVVHLLIDPRNDWGENLSRELGLPVVSLGDRGAADLGAELAKPEYGDGFILEGFPADAAQAEELDALLQNVAPEGRRVLGWELSDQAHQEVLDHYMDRDLLWMVPQAGDPRDPQQVKSNMLSCLQGLPALR